MAGKAVDVIIKAIQDPSYNKLLFADPDRALAGYILSRTELASLKNLSRSSFDAAVASISADFQSRIKRGGSDVDGASVSSLDYPVIENRDWR